MNPWLLVAGDFRPGGGMDQANYHLAWHLAENLGREVTLVAHHVAEPLAGHRRVRVVAVRRPFGLHLLGAPLLDRAGWIEARRLLAQRPDARVLTNGGNCLWPAFNWVHVVHHAWRSRDEGAPWAFRLKNRFDRHRQRRRERRALAACPLAIANSHKTANELTRMVGVADDKVRVVYLASDPERFRPPTTEERHQARQTLGLPAEGFVGLFVGALGYDRNKGLDVLLRAWQLAGDGFGSLLAAGAGRLGFWQKQIDSMTLSGQVRLVGHTADVFTLLAASDVFVSPTRYDAYGLAVHEALCCGLPALVSRAAGVAERFPQELSELILPDADDALDLAVRLRRCRDGLAHYRELVAPFGAALRQRTWADVAADVVRLVESA
jgi:glycosyltransferase involved in cell wall biosynthesis